MDQSARGGGKREIPFSRETQSLSKEVAECGDFQRGP